MKRNTMKKLLKKLLAPLIREVVEEKLMGIRTILLLLLKENDRATTPKRKDPINITIRHLIGTLSVVTPSAEGASHSDKYPQQLVKDLEQVLLSAVTEALNKFCNDLEPLQKDCPDKEQEEEHR